jgi:hypothetical protein
MESEQRIIIDKVITAFERYALGNMKTVAEQKMPIAAFILASCLIDQLSGFVYGVKYLQGTPRSVKFVEEYLNKVAAREYHKESLIKILRKMNSFIIIR